MKQKLDLQPITLVEEIFSEHLTFLPHSTQKRNLAYQFQHLEFLTKLYNKYHLYASVKAVYFQQVLHLYHQTIESIMYCVARKEGVITENEKGHIKYVRLVHIMKSKIGISKDLRRELKSINDKRNNQHPQAQKDKLHLNTYTVSEVNEAREAFKKLLQELSAHYSKEKRMSHNI